MCFDVVVNNFLLTLVEILKFCPIPFSFLFYVSCCFIVLNAFTQLRRLSVLICSHRKDKNIRLY